MKRIIGLLAILLGVVGVVLLGTGGIAVWRVEFAAVDRTDRAMTRTSEHLQKAEGRLQRMEEKVQTVTVNLEVARAALARLVERAVQNVAARTELQQLLERLDGLLVQSEEFGATLSIVARLIEDIADLSTQFDGNPDRTERLRNVADTLEQAAAELVNIRTELADLRLREAATNPQNLADIVVRCRGPLERLSGGIASIRQYSTDTRGSLEHLRDQVHFWMRAMVVLVSFVFLWFGLGQVCLIGWGWRRLRPRPALIAQG